MNDVDEVIHRIEGAIAQAELLAASELTKMEREVLSDALMKIGVAVSTLVERDLMGDE